MTSESKIAILSILSGKWLKTREQVDLESAVIASLLNDLIPHEQLPLTVTEVYRDAPHIITTHGNIQEAMTKIDTVRKVNNEKLYAVHITRGEVVEYSWEAQ